jgi:threonine aldolase
MLAAAPVVGSASVHGRGGAKRETASSDDGVVKLFGDGLGLSAAEYVGVLQAILEKRGIEEDYYSRGGVVEELEERFASALGKERAIYFPTGTLANHVAIRQLAGARARVVVPDVSHIYNDSGDCAQQLSQLNLIPLSAETATFSLEQVESVVDRTRSGRVETGIGALVIESPVRRKLGEVFDFAEMKRICAFARANDIRTHLDGARLYMASAYTGVSPAEYASHFDTVYVSLWKYFNAGSGAILAGTRGVIEDLYHTRRMFGGGLPAAWQYAAVALHYFESFEGEFAHAVRVADELVSMLVQTDSFRVERIPKGSNIFRLRVRGVETNRFRDGLDERGVRLSTPRSDSGDFLIAVNATWNRSSAEALARKFQDAVSASA